MIIIVFVLIIAILIFVSFQYFKMTINEILQKLITLDKIFEERYTELTKAIAQFQKYLPEQKNLIFDIQKAKADAASVSKPKTTQELTQKIINENALTVNISYLLDKCDFKNLQPDLKKHVEIQANCIHKINAAAQDYNRLITEYKKIKNIFPFNLYSKIINIDLDLDLIKTE